MTRSPFARAAAQLFIALTGLAPAAAAANAPPRNWHDEKCARYTKAWDGALARRGPAGLGQAFLDRHAAFLASNCTTKADVCPRSPAEFALANDMVVLSMNAGTASTFPPFACPK